MTALKKAIPSAAADASSFVIAAYLNVRFIPSATELWRTTPCIMIFLLRCLKFDFFKGIRYNASYNKH
ncbi:MAG: hypothetical protein QG578_1428 [Thermodesulfobacteriota bacterium]|nr:hypothetical protein [Thermodesulfobacteriota bacterium]